MKLKNYLMMLLVALFAISCSNDDDEVTYASDVIAGTYSGYSWTSFFGGSYTMLAEGESVSLTSNADGTLGVSFTSSTWGTTTISAATVATGSDGYTISGSGSTVMENHNTNTSATYDCTVTGTVSANNSDVELTFSIPAVMSGTTITFHTGSAPAGMAVAGTYEGYTSAAFMYVSTPMITNEESVKLTYNDDGTVTLSYTSDTWGTATISGATVETSTSGYTLSGTGEVAMANHSTGSTTSYDCTVTGTINADKDDVEFIISIPSVMGGTTITFQTGYAPANEFLAGTYEGYTSTTFTYVTTPMITDGESITITGNDDGTIDLSYTSGTWGTTTISAATVEVSDEGVYTLSGEGTSLMGMSGSATSEYACTLSGTISADKEDVEINITLSIMGGTTITFHTGDAPTEDSAE